MMQPSSGNPWFSMWSQPRSTIRSIIQSRPSYGVYCLATLYALQSFLFYANWWSLALSDHSSTLIFLGLLFSPILGICWLYFMTSIYFLTGRALKGKAPFQHLRAAVAWSSLPYFISLLMWATLLFLSDESIFIQPAKGPSSIFISLITLIIGVWSFGLLVQSIAEVQQFSLSRSICNVIFASILSFIFFFLFFSLFRLFV